MSLIGLVRQAANGQASWSEVIKKAESLFVEGVIDPMEVFASQFLTDFGKFAMTEAENYIPKLIAGEISFPDAGAQILADAEKAAVEIAKTDALNVAQNALRVKLTVVQLAAPKTE